MTLKSEANVQQFTLKLHRLFWQSGDFTGRAEKEDNCKAGTVYMCRLNIQSFNSLSRTCSQEVTLLRGRKHKLMVHF